VAFGVQVAGGGTWVQSGIITSAEKAIEPAARPIGGTRPCRCLMSTPAQPQNAAPAMPTIEASAVFQDSSTGPRLTISATPATPSAKPAMRFAPSGSFSTGTAISAVHSGTMPLMIAR